MKRIKVISLLLILIILFVGCEKKEEEKKLVSIADNGIETSKKPEGVNVITDVKDFVKANDDQQYNIETDASLTVRSEYGIAESEEAYYFVELDKLYFYEKETGKYRIACNKPDCAHTTSNEKCNADIHTNNYNTIQYYEGFIYYVVKEANEFNLYKKSVEEGITEKVFNIQSVEQKAQTNSNMQICWVIHRGYIYYVGQFGSGITEDTYYLNNSNCFSRIKLEGDSKPEILMPLPAEAMLVNPYLTKIQASGSYVYYLSPYYNEKARDLVSSIYRYNAEANHIEVIDIGEVSMLNCMVSGENVYYKKLDLSNKLYAYNVNTNESTEFVSEEEGQDISSLLPYKDGVIIADDKDYCYGKDGVLKGVIPECKSENVEKSLNLGGDDEKIFFKMDYTSEYAQVAGKTSCIAYYDIKADEYVFLE